MRLHWLFLLAVACVPRLSAGPSIVWSGQQDISMGPYGPGEPSFAEWILDFNNDGVSDLLFSFATEVFLVSPYGANQTVVTPGEAIAESAVLPFGSDISTALVAPFSWSGDAQELVHWFGLFPDDVVCDGPWAGVQNQYLGVSFGIDGQTHYGWVEVSASDEIFYGTIHSWAYESQSGVGLVAGVVPEPSTIELFAVGLGCLGVRFVRRRKRLKAATQRSCQPEGAGDSQ